MGYTRSAVAGFSWQTILKLLTNGIAVVKLATLARLLSPEDFGVFSLVVIALGLTESFTQTGVNVTILQSSKPTSFFVNSAWVIAIVRGLIIALVMIGLGQGMQYFFHQPNLWFLVALAALIPLIKGFINPAIVSLQKELKFSADTLYRFSLIVVDAVASVIAVWYLRSVTGWVIGMIVAALFEVGISFIFFKLRPRFKFSWVEAKAIFKNAKGLGLSSLLSYLNENMDNLLIGRLLGTFALGLYQPTYGICHEANYELAKSANHGTMPIYSRLLKEPGRLKRAFSKASASTLGLGLLLSLPLLFFPGPIINFIFSDKWSGAIELVPWLVVAGWLQAMIMVVYSLFFARNYLKIMNFHALVTFIAMVGGIWYFTQHYGLIGAGMGLVVSRLIGLPVLLWGAKKALDYA